MATYNTTRHVGSIENFKSAIPNIQRASLFDVTIDNFKYSVNGAANNGYLLKFSVKTATFPEASVGDIPVPYMGRKVHFYGSREYGGTWATTVILDGEWSIYNDIYVWNQAMNGAERIVSEHMNSHPNFKVDALLSAYSTDGQLAKQVILHGLWPKEVGSLNMNWDSDGAVDLSVTWVYDYVTTNYAQASDNRHTASRIGIQTVEGGTNYMESVSSRVNTMA